MTSKINTAKKKTKFDRNLVAKAESPSKIKGNKERN